MKIGIISLPLSYNYGGYLQCYALLEILRNMGHEVCFLQRESDGTPTRIKTVIEYTKLILERLGLGFFVYELEKRTNTGLFYKTKYFRAFTRKYIRNVSPTFHSTEDLATFCKKKQFDVYITGSDQIWRAEYCRSLNDSFLGFAPKDALKLSYAASFGTDTWNFSFDQSIFIEKALNHFKAISVRELDGIELIIKNLHVNNSPKLVLDPTFLLPKEHYMRMAENGPKRKGILTYILSDKQEKRQLVEHISQFEKLPTFSVINPLTNTTIIRNGQGYPVEHWLAGFRDANLVLTDSFHATVFSIIFGKPFWVFNNTERGNSRIINLLTILGCKERFVTSKDFNNVDWNAPLDWNGINNHKESLINESMSFLKENLR